MHGLAHSSASLLVDEEVSGYDEPALNVTGALKTENWLPELSHARSDGPAGVAPAFLTTWGWGTVLSCAVQRNFPPCGVLTPHGKEKARWQKAPLAEIREESRYESEGHSQAGCGEEAGDTRPPSEKAGGNSCARRPSAVAGFGMGTHAVRDHEYVAHSLRETNVVRVHCGVERRTVKDGRGNGRPQAVQFPARLLL
jgi:hypothetical protein